MCSCAIERHVWLPIDRDVERTVEWRLPRIQALIEHCYNSLGLRNLQEKVDLKDKASIFE